ncbi:MAG: transporter [Ilumatobacteraceae bacterium]|nr:transporter [Ilumatobacteraceae bacterium]
MNEHIGFLLRGLGSGGVFAALAMALVVTYRSSGVVNFATGAIALYTAETYALLRSGQLFNPIPFLSAKVKIADRLGFAPAVAIALIIAAVLGVVLHYVVFRPLRPAPAVAKAVASVGVMIVLQADIGLRLGTKVVVTKAILPTKNYKILGQAIRGDRLWFAAAVVAIAVVLWAVFRFTRFGLATRAAAETEKGALVTGLSPERIALSNWAISAVVSGIAGILISPIVPIIPISYTLFIVPALAAALVGGFTSVGPAVAAGLVIGMLQSDLTFVQTKYSWFPKAGGPELVPLILIIVVLVIRGRPLPDRAAFITKTLGRAPRPRRIAAPSVVAVAAGAALIVVTSGGYRSAVILTFIYGIVALSWVVVTGYAGQVSLAQLALAGVGAFSLHRFAVTLGVPFPFAPLLAATAAAVIGVVVGLPALRIRGLPVAVVTLALAVSLEAFWFLNPDFNGGLKGAPIAPPSIFGWKFRLDALSSRIPFALLCLGVLACVAVAVAVLRRSRLGAAMLAVKANERSAAAAGINVARTKLVAFGIGAFIAGLGGSLLAYQQGSAVPQTYNSVLGVGVFATVYLAGITSVSGGITAGVLSAGGIVFIFLDRNLELGGWYPAIAGAFLVFTVIRSPEGIAGEFHKLTDRIRQRGNATEPALPAFEATALSIVPPATTVGPPILTVRGLSVRFGGVVAVSDVSFEVQAGSIVGLIGPNGAGKTTLIDAISGYVTCSGSVELDSGDISGLVPYRRSRLGLGRTFQSVELYEGLTVEENIAVGQHAARQRPGVDIGDDDLDRLCNLLELNDVRDRPIRELSAGYRQLVSVARALAGHPRVVLLDEPAGGLDTDESQWLGQRLLEVRAAGITVVMIDHDMSLVLNVCDQIHVLDLGSIIASGTPAQVQSDPRVAEAYLGTTHAHVGGPGVEEVA